MNKLPIVISASRMTDMPAFYPEALITEMDTRISKGITIHSLVLWTKHPQSLFLSPLYPYLQNLLQKGIQLFIHLTITGMGGVTVCNDTEGNPIIPEPKVPPADKTIETIPKVIELVGNVNRIRVRIDPVLRIQNTKGDIYTNLTHFEPIVIKCRAKGIRNFSFSFLEKGVYGKVDKRFFNRGVTILSPNTEERLQMSKWITGLEKKYNITISACCVPEMVPSRCIDGYLLDSLHNRKLTAGHKEPRSRALCGCTESIDIGGWPPKICASGCLYCYARPAIHRYK